MTCSPGRAVVRELDQEQEQGQGCSSKPNAPVLFYRVPQETEGPATVLWPRKSRQGGPNP